MNLHTLYFSPTKTTQKIVNAICNGIGSNSVDYDITLKKDRNASLKFNDEDCLIIGLPVYAGRIPELTEAFMHRLKGQSTPVVLVAVYGNRDYDDALLEMKNLLEKQGFVPIAAGAFIGEHSYTQNVATNRPDSNDLHLANELAKKVKELLQNESFKGLSLQVKGNYPYRNRPSSLPVGPIVNEACIKCGTCVNGCPTDSLKLEEVIHVDEEKCVRCHACTRNCPVSAIAFDDRTAHIKKWLEDSFSERKEPEMFYV